MKQHMQLFGLALGMLMVSMSAWSATGDETPSTDQPGVVYLHRSTQWRLPSKRGFTSGILTRELARQAFLISARDQLGFTTRDFWLGDQMPQQGANRPFDLSTAKDKTSGWELRRGFFPDTVAISDGEFSLVESPPFKIAGHSITEGIDYAALTAEMETLSRTRFVKALQEAGFAGKANTWRDDAPVPEDVARMLDEMTFIPQYQAVRRLHALIRSDGESFDRLCALARSYANLGMLTEFHWHPAHKVFKARALLYAQRLAAAQPKDYLAVLHRAYALAAAGCHRLALRDLELAETLRRESGGAKDAQPPEWRDLIEAHCKFDIERLDATKIKGPTAQLAWLLRSMSLEMCDDTAMTVSAELAAVEALPECYRIHDGLCAFAGVSVQHRSTSQWFDIAGRTIYSRLSAGELPPPVAEVVKEGIVLQRAEEVPWPKEFPLRGKLIAALRAAPDRDGEPSWATLANLIEELSFVQVKRRAEFERNFLAVSAEEFLALAAPLTAAHPFRGYLDTFAAEDKQPAAWANLNIPVTDGLELHERAMCERYFKNLGIKTESAPYSTQSDCTARDKTQVMSLDYFPKNRHFTLLCVSPYSPWGRAAALETSDEVFRLEYDNWSGGAAKFPRLARGFAQRCALEDRYEEAAQWLEKAIVLSPEYATYIRLGRVYAKLKQMDKWLATMEAVLDQPDYGLNHAGVSSFIARWHMRNKQWSKAETFAMAAAESYSEWGLKTAADWYEGTRKWKQAEEIHQALAERYAGNEFNRYFLCKRTGHGDLKALQESAQKTMESFLAKPKEQQVWKFGHVYYLLVAGERARSKEILTSLYNKYGDPIYGLHLTLIADEDGDSKQRDSFLQDIRQRGIKFVPPTHRMPYDGLVQLAGILAEDLANGGKGEIDFAKADQIAEKSNVDELDRHNVSCRSLMFKYFLAKYLSLHGQTDKAVEYWKKCMSETEILYHYYRTLAGAELNNRDIRLESYMKDSEEEKEQPEKKEKGDAAQSPQ